MILSYKRDCMENHFEEKEEKLKSKGAEERTNDFHLIEAIIEFAR